MKKLTFSILFLLVSLLSFGQIQDEKVNNGSQKVTAENLHDGHDHGESGVKNCMHGDPNKHLEIQKNGNCPALTDYVIHTTGKKFFETYPDFPSCPNIGNIILNKEEYYKAINDWCSKHPNDAELIHQILGFNTELPLK
jgi:hypothetical protein